MENLIKSGLLKTPKEKRDKEFKFGAFFPLPKLSELPEEFRVAEPIIKNQGNTLLCTAFASSSVSEDQEGVELDPIYQAKLISDIVGHDITNTGADLHSACKSLLRGSLEQKDSEALNKEELATLHAKEAYFEVTGQTDTYDDIRLALYANREQKRSLLTGIMWYPEWTYAEYGIIPLKYKTEASSAHAIKIFGWTNMGLLLQNSYGENIGDKGIYYLPRSVANKELTFGAYTFADMPPMTKEEAIKKSQWYKLSLIKKALFLMSQLLTELLKVFKPTTSEQIVPEPIPVIDSIPLPETAKEKYLWDTEENVRHSIRVLCDECNLNVFHKDLICRIAKCESGDKEHPTGNPKAKLVNNPKSIDKGLFQINSYWHPEVSEEQAYDPEFATRWAIQALKDGKVKTYWNASRLCWNKDGKYDIFLRE